ncbi:VCBS repeat-containing protein [Hymenobacter sp. M29]|uniref:VCBS repeat-containing protein n=1 Tax=Hymenobacter mellowenesis TaxID=3063995 RepID=A0ABT9AGM6_9BACT|nr:VCBS repeat-containing protein [Hymenobacter sp. M29]MDO7848479.1 VCBS repeat-containing protein [Hymenobacter sp. M29]
MLKSCLYLLPLWCLAGLLLAGCQAKQPEAGLPTLFQLVAPAKSHVTFRNDLQEDEFTNVLVYEYTYNGGGVALGDVNGDGLDDIYFTANKGSNRLYLNQGHLQFQDVTAAAGVGLAEGWKTGVTMVDLNADGRLDMYVCRSGDRPGRLRQNQLFINQGADARGVPHFTEQAAACGLADSAFSTQAVFFDYDQDRDLDMLLLNHSPRRFEGLDEFYIRQLMATPDALTGLKLYRNEGGAPGRLPQFREVATAAGLLNARLSFGLGASVADVNNDGWPDIYVSNDYLTPDCLYINNKNGTFTDQLSQQIGHTSLSSMGNDAADLNNDGYADICTLDMLPEGNRRQKLLFASDNFEQFRTRENAGLHKQYMRNMLQLNNGNGSFSEVGQLAGIAATDWSWAPLLADFDNDGWKDLFVTNGFLHDYTNLDFLKYMGDFLHDRQGNVQRNNLLELVRKMPSSNVVGYAFRNIGGARFANVSMAWGITTPANSNGAAYADLDNDGDLDLVVNNINAEAFIYRNDASKLLKNKTLRVKLQGEGQNRLGLGTKVTLFSGGHLQTQEQLVGRGYESSVSPVLHFGLGQRPIDSVLVVWPGGRRQVVRPAAGQQLLVLREANGQPAGPTSQSFSPVFTAATSPIRAVATENDVNDFKRQPLMVNSLSYGGPYLVQGDVNNDGRADLFMGGTVGHPSRVFVQRAGGVFAEVPQPALHADSLQEASAAAFLDVDGDGDQDLYVGTGGYDNFLPEDPLLQDRLYLNDGRGHFSASPPGSLPPMRTSTGCVRAADVNSDGHPDLFVGGRVVPGRYPEAPASYLLVGDGHGHFADQTARYAPALRQLGMVTDAAWVDLNGDQRPDLITVGEWLPVQVWLNEPGRLVDRTATYLPARLRGWWNTLLVHDLNGDHKPDLVVGNMGLNTQCRASAQQPAELVYKDFDDNGAIDPILCMYAQDQSYPFVSRDELLDQISMTRSRFPSYASYSEARLPDIFSPEELKDAHVLRASCLQTTCFLSTPQTRYRLAPLPAEAQYTPIYALATLDYDHDGHPDLLLGGNITHSRIRFGNSDAGQGLLLRGDGRGGFATVPQRQSGLRVAGDIRSFAQVGRTLLVGRNNLPVQAYQLHHP